MLSLEELLLLNKKKDIPMQINLSSFVYFLMALGGLFYLYTNFSIVLCFIIIILLLMALSGYFDFKYITGMYGDSRLSELSKETCSEIELLYNHFKTDFFYSSLKFDFRLEKNEIIIIKDSKVIYSYNFETKNITNHLNTDFSISYLNFLNEVEYKYIEFNRNQKKA